MIPTEENRSSNSLEQPNHIVFSFYYINTNNEVDKILKNKVAVSNDSSTFHRNRLFNEIMKYKQQYYQHVFLHEILFYQNTDEPISYFQETNSASTPQDIFKKIHYAYDISLLPTDEHFRSLTHVYVIFKAKPYLKHPSTTKNTTNLLTMKHKKKSKQFTRKL